MRVGECVNESGLDAAAEKGRLTFKLVLEPAAALLDVRPALRRRLSLCHPSHRFTPARSALACRPALIVCGGRAQVASSKAGGAAEVAAAKVETEKADAAAAI
eukprot:3243684-Prymnesium_polylepis.1